MDLHLPKSLGAPVSTASDESRLPRTVYKFTSRLDNASLRVLDAGVITVAWLLAYLAGFEGSVPHDLAGGPILFLALPVVTQLVVNQRRGSVRTGLALRVRRGGRSRRRRGVRRAPSSRRFELARRRQVSDMHAARVHRRRRSPR